MGKILVIVSMKENLKTTIDLSHTNIPNPLIREKDLLKYFRDSSMYIDADTRNELCTEISKWLKVPTNLILLGNGIAELIEIITYWIPKGKIIIYAPTFIFYERCAKKYHRNYEILNWVWEKDMLDIRKKLKEEPSLIWITNPNSPTGHYLVLSTIEYVLNTTNAIIAIDESFVEFGEKSLIELAISSNRIIVLRTFSKAFGLAGVRIGYCISNEKTIRELSKIIEPMTTSRLGVVLAKECITNYLNEYKLVWACTISSLEIFKNSLKSNLYHILSGKCNFLCLRFNLHCDAVLFNKLCLEEKITVGTGWNGEFSGDSSNLIRITLPSPDSFQESIKRFERIKQSFEKLTA